jgi:hypothetical protein
MSLDPTRECICAECRRQIDEMGVGVRAWRPKRVHADT